MARRVPPVPEDFHTITPHIVVRDVPSAVAFYAAAFGAHELLRNPSPDGKRVMHSELLLGDSRFFVHDEFPEYGVRGPSGDGRAPFTLHLYVADVDRLFARAVAAGAEVMMPLQDCFWGDRYGILKDPFGHQWSLASRIEDLSPAELQERARAVRWDEKRT